MKRLFGTLFFIAFGLSGCAAFVSPGYEPQFERIEKTYTGTRKPMSYRWLEVSGSDEIDLNRDVLIADLRRWGWDPRAAQMPTGKYPHLLVSVATHTNPGALVFAFITGFSFYTVPSWATIRVDVSVLVTDVNGKEVTIERSGKGTLVQWLPMIFAFPWAYPFDVEDRVIQGIYEELAGELALGFGHAKLVKPPGTDVTEPGS